MPSTDPVSSITNCYHLIVSYTDPVNSILSTFFLLQICIRYVSDDMENNLIPKMEDSSAKTWEGKYFYLYRTCEIIQKYGRISISICIEHVRLHKLVLISYLEKSLVF